MDKKEQSAEPVNDDDDIEIIREPIFPTRDGAGKLLLRLSPYAWAKIRWIRDYCGSEIAGFGISSQDDPFFLEDFRTIKQQASIAHFEFDDDALAVYQADMFDEGKEPADCMRLWLHTHPGNDFASPSGHDDDKFAECFGKADWAMMIIVDGGDNIYARMRINSGKTKLQVVVPTEVNYQPPFRGVDNDILIAWQTEADNNIQRAQTQLTAFTDPHRLPAEHNHRRHEYAHCYDDDYYSQDPARRASYRDNDEYYAHALLGGLHADTPSEGPWENVNAMISGHERVVDITAAKDGGILVLLNSVWLTYNDDVTPKVKLGSTIECPTDIADIPPTRCGELSWDYDGKGGATPRFDSEMVDGFVQYFRSEEEVDEDLEVEHVGTVRRPGH